MGRCGDAAVQAVGSETSEGHTGGAPLPPFFCARRRVARLVGPWIPTCESSRFGGRVAWLFIRVRRSPASQSRSLTVRDGARKRSEARSRRAQCSPVRCSTVGAMSRAGCPASAGEPSSKRQQAGSGIVQASIRRPIKPSSRHRRHRQTPIAPHHIDAPRNVAVLPQC